LRLPNMSIAYPQKVSSEQPFPVRVDFGSRFPLVSEKFPTPGGTPVLRRAYMDVAICIAPAGA
jgi:hypothetical protein